MVSAPELARLLDPLGKRVRLAIGRAVLRAVADAGGLQRVQIEALAGEVIDGSERFQQYGMSSHPHPGAEAIVLALGGNRNHAVVIAVDDRRYRLQALEAGEVALYDDQEQVVLLRRDGILIRTADRAVTVEAKTVSIEASELARLDAREIEVHAAERLRLDCGGYGETWYPTRRDTWTQGAQSGSAHPISPPEHAE